MTVFTVGCTASTCDTGTQLCCASVETDGTSACVSNTGGCPPGELQVCGTDTVCANGGTCIPWMCGNITVYYCDGVGTILPTCTTGMGFPLPH